MWRGHSPRSVPASSAVAVPRYAACTAALARISDGVPCAITLPKSSTVISASDSSSTSSTSCSTMTKADAALVACGAQRGRHLLGLVHVEPRRRLVEQHDRGSVASARAISTIRPVPSGSSATGRSATASSASSDNDAGRRPRPRRPSAGSRARRGRGSSGGRARWRTRWASTRCSRTVSSPNSSSRWNVRAKPEARAALRAGPGDVDTAEQDLARRVVARAPRAHRTAWSCPPRSGPTRPVIVPAAAAKSTRRARPRRRSCTVTPVAVRRGSRS